MSIEQQLITKYRQQMRCRKNQSGEVSESEARNCAQCIITGLARRKECATPRTTVYPAMGSRTPDVFYNGTAAVTSTVRT